LHRLVEELLDEQVPAVLADVQRHLMAVPGGSWPPAWFGAIEADRTDIARDHEGLLAEGFGRSA
jgi:hypothetical protein